MKRPDDPDAALLRCLAISGPIFATVIFLVAIIHGAVADEPCRPFRNVGANGAGLEAVNAHP